MYGHTRLSVLQLMDAHFSQFGEMINKAAGRQVCISPTEGTSSVSLTLPKTGGVREARA